MPKRKHTPRELEAMGRDYFNSISYTRQVTDSHGEPLLNDAGQPLREQVYIKEPTIHAMCYYMDISPGTFSGYLADRRLGTVAQRLKRRVEVRRSEQLVSSEHSRALRGIEFDLKNNYGWQEAGEAEKEDTTLKAVGERMTIEEKLEEIRKAAADYARQK